MGEDLSAVVARHARRHDLLPPGAPVLALVSGGADSACLMHVLPEVHDGPVGVLTLDHGLRPESAGETATVLEAAGKLGLPAWSVHLGVPPGTGLQERARDARYAAAREHAASHGFLLIATGHTASDQAETVLFRIARGTGRSGAVGMAPRAGDLIRPLLCVTREQARAWCERRGLCYVEDPSNADDRYARSRVRHRLLPALQSVHPGAELAIVRFADQLRDEAEVLDRAVDEAWERCARGGGLDAVLVGREHPAIARLLARRLLVSAGVTADAAQVALTLDLACRGGRPVEVPGGLVAVDRGVLVAERTPPAAPRPVALEVPGAVTFGGLVVRARRGRSGPPEPGRVAVAVDRPLQVRSPRPGDRMRLGPGGRQAVGRLLAAAGVPERRRSAVPIVVCDDRIVWVAGYRADPDLLAAPGATATVLEVTPA